MDDGSIRERGQGVRERDKSSGLTMLLFVLSAFMCGVVLYMMAQAPYIVATHQVENMQDRRSTIEFSSIAPTRSRIMARELEIPDYWNAKGFSVVFFAEVDTTGPPEHATSQMWMYVDFSIVCRYSFMTDKTFVLVPLGHFDDRGIACARRLRVPTSQMVQKRMCSLVVTPASTLPVESLRTRSLTLDWSLVIVPILHWTDWFPRQITDEYYRAISMTGLQVAPPAGSNYSDWYGVTSPYGTVPSNTDEWCRDFKIGMTEAAISLAVYEAKLDKEAAYEAEHKK